MIIGRRRVQAFSITRSLGIYQWRSLTSSAALFSGHNRWSKIKHDKGANDAAKSKERSIVSKDLTMAVKQYGPDPAFNPRLTHCIGVAKKAGFSKTSIDTAILRGQNKSLSGLPLEALTLEAMLPPQVACVIECLTESKNRVLADLRHAITKWGGSITSTAFLFEKKGRIVLETKENITLDGILDQVIEAGAIDANEDDEGRIVIDTEPSDINNVTQSLVQDMHLQVASADIIYDPKEDTMIDVEEEAAEKLEKILDLVRQEPAVQDIYLNAR